MNGQGNDRHNTHEQITLTTTQARQGITPHVTRYVLSGGLALVALAFILIYFFQL
jgi:hypothetical protein